MGSLSLWHWLVVIALVMVLFGGGGKIPRLAKDLAQGINAFKKGMKETKETKADGNGEMIDKQG